MGKLIFNMTLILFFLVNCSSGSIAEEVEIDPNQQINYMKLSGTPFEGIEQFANDFDDEFFLCGKYRTEMIDSYPIKIFAALFTAEEEEDIKEGIGVANNGIGFDYFEYTDEWSDDVRVMYKVSNLDEQVFPADARTTWEKRSFDGKTIAAVVATDWIIRFNIDGGSADLVAHELGHAMGILGHSLINYEEDRNDVDALEENSVMEFPMPPGIPVYNDYNFMMARQFEIVNEHLGEEGDFSSCKCSEGC